MTALEVAAKLLGCLLVFLTVPLLVGQMEHKAMAHMQSRLGPMYAGGFHGWAQLVADGVKFAQKESVVPARADRRVFELAPAVALLPYLFVLVTIPVGPGQTARDLSAGVVVFSALTAVLFLGGWKGPFLEHQLGWLWLLLKTLALSFIVIWLRVTYPRLREDQLQKFAWVALVPLALGQVALTGVVRVVTA